MFIETEATPNPSAIKFLPGRALHLGDPVDIPSAEIADTVSPLAAAFFALEGVTRVLIGYDFIVVMLEDAAQWQKMKPIVLSVLMEGLILETPIVLQEGGGEEDAPVFDPADEHIVKQICALIDERVRPAVAMDGGDILFKGFDRGVVFLSMRGACAGCPSSTATLKGGIENMLRHLIPEVVEVRAAAF
ncbi:MAG: NifU family protein [Alphaproteobacteria bacterium]|nr:NifU family protein [Alphaproteobacteria bacterium]